MTRRLSRIALSVAAASLSVLAFSQEAQAFSWQEFRPVLSLGAGPSYSTNVGQSVTFPIQDPITDQYYIYTATNQSQSNLLLDAFLGAEWSYTPCWAFQMGLDYNRVTEYPKGTYIQGADVQSQDQWTYSYNIRSSQLLAEGKLLYQFNDIYHPYVLLGVGAVFNRAEAYSTNVPPFLTFTRMYAVHSSTSWSYAAGLGLDVDLTDHLRVGAGYRFADLGTAQLGNAVIDTTAVPGVLPSTRLYSNEVLGQVTIVF